MTPVSATPTHMLRICVNPSFKHLLSPRGDRCEQSSPDRFTIAYHGYRFETLNADSDSLLCHVWLRQTSRELTDSRSERGRRRRDRVFKFGCVSRCEHSKIGFISAIYYSNTSSVAVNRATFSHWRRLIKHINADCIDAILPSVLMRLFIFRKQGHLASLLQWEKVAAVG